MSGKKQKQKRAILKTATDAMYKYLSENSSKTPDKKVIYKQLDKLFKTKGIKAIQLSIRTLQKVEEETQQQKERLNGKPK